MKKLRWLLPFVLSIILVPVLSVLVFSGFGIYRQQRAMNTMAERYAQSLSRSIIQEEMGSPGETPLSRHRRLGLFLKMLTLGPPVPGWIAIVGPGGVKLQGSPGSRITPLMATLTDTALDTGEMQTFTLFSSRYPPAAAVIRPYPDGIRAVIVVISHYSLPGSMMRAMQFQPILSIAVSIVALFGIFLLWRWCVMPLRKLASRVETVQWGKETLDTGSVGPLPELKQMRQALSELSASAVDRAKLKKNYVDDIVRTQEEERTRLAREIHDSPLQTVTSMIQRVQLARRGLDRAEPDKKRIVGHLDAAQEAALLAVQEMRDVCDRLSPPWLSLGAVRAVEEICRRLSRIHSVAVTQTVTGEAETLNEKDVLALCRIIQEAVANAVRHGSATAVDVKLDCSGDPFCLTITDNGKGIDGQIDPEVLRVQGHRGISGMTERASLMGASFNIARAPEGGTVITVALPARSRRDASPAAFRSENSTQPPLGETHDKGPCSPSLPEQK
ncbi:MAG: sensor histidine kinase [Pyramidobacter sp.]|jgi:signal transduction histidine kinase